MSQDLRNLLIEQELTIKSIKRVLVNYKKLSKQNITLSKTKGRLSNLEELWKKCQALHVRLMQTATTEEQRSTQYFAKDEILDVEDAFLEAADYLNDAIGKFTKVETAPSDKGNESSFRDSLSATALQLPRITLPKFSGNFSEWENFRGIFESLVATNDSLSNTQKLHYLKASLSGDAALLVSNIRVSDANYDAAWQLLAKEYDNQNAIIHAHIHAFADLPKMKTETVSELKRLRDNVSVSLAALTNLDRLVSQWDDLLVYIILQKFSTRTRNEWSLTRGNSDVYPTYKEIHDFMTCRIRGLADYNTQSSSATNNSNNKSRSSINHVATVKCVKCSGNHSLAKCDSFLAQSVDQRRLFARQHKCCFNCLRPDHQLRNCQSKGRCITCRRAHHSLLHSDNDARDRRLDSCAAASPSDSSSNNKASLPSMPAPQPAAVASVQSVHATRKNMNSPPHVLLATAWVSLTTAEGRTFKLRALLDQGSTYSFISESLCQAMRTKRYRTGLKIHCFGEKFSGVAK